MSELKPQHYWIGWGLLAALILGGLIMEKMQHIERMEQMQKMRGSRGRLVEPIKTQPWITCNKDQTSCVVRELPSPVQ